MKTKDYIESELCWSLLSIDLMFDTRVRAYIRAYSLSVDRGMSDSEMSMMVGVLWLRSL